MRESESFKPLRILASKQNGKIRLVFCFVFGGGGGKETLFGRGEKKTNIEIKILFFVWGGCPIFVLLSYGESNLG